MSYIFIFIFGLIVGSFLNVIICHLKTKEQILFGRSHCPECRAVLKWRDLIPVFSFILQKGKCRYCGKKISYQYPIVEIITALLFLQITNSKLQIPNYNIENLVIFFYSLLIICFLIIIFVYDLKHYIIPDKVVYPAIIIAGIFNFQFSIFNQFSIFQFSIWSALGASLFFLAIVLISKGKWMGLGDVKLVFLMGLILGWPGILIALLIAFFSGAVIGLGLILFGKKGLKSQIPFGPFLSGATILVVLFGSIFNVDNFLLFL